MFVKFLLQCSDRNSKFWVPKVHKGEGNSGRLDIYIETEENLVLEILHTKC